MHFENDYLNFKDIYQDRLNRAIPNVDIHFIFASYEQEQVRNIYPQNTPFASKPLCSYNGMFCIAYNPSIIDRLGLTEKEQYACILHEIGHYLNESTLEKTYDESMAIECLCDNYAVLMDLGGELQSVLQKICNLDPNIDIRKRIDCLRKGEQCYIRPEWTCGRYDAQHKAAIYYNLIAGMSYYLEDYSAQIIGYILNVGKQQSFTLADLSKHINITPDILDPFMCELVSNFMITPPTAIIDTYRDSVAKQRRFSLSRERSIEQKLPMAVSNAEMDYARRVGGITNVMFELTYRCSERCIHCYNPGATRNDSEESYRGNRQEMTLNDYKRVIDELYEQGLTKVCLSGGDPFSNTLVWEIIDYLKKKDVAFDVFTNGQMLLGRTRQLADYYPRLVGVSIYSGIPAEHDYITRVKGSWEKSIQVVKELSELAVPLNLKCCVMKPNLDSYHLVTDIAKKYGAVAQFEISLTDSIEGDKCVSRYLRLDPEEYEIILRDSNIPLYVGKETPDYGRQVRDYTQNPCGAGYNTFCITPEGDMIPCCSFHLSFGNICRESVAEILESYKLKWWRGLKLSDYEECGKYEYCDYCNLCPGNNHSQWGTPLKAGENNCYVAKIRHCLAMKMKDEGYDPLKGRSLVEVLKSHKNNKIKIKREISREKDGLE
ncbi:MAG: radical SAM protein [Bacteroidales bacterium]|nr:radical SAM protein [Bacteroidales bacterium]